MTPPFVAAKRLAQAGLPVFFCNAKKFPTCKGGFKAATSDPEQLLDLWRRSPGPLIGVATGAASGIDALDIDPKDCGLLWLGDHCATLPTTRTHGTRSGGYHFLFQHHPGLRCSASKIAPGVDVRADGGYIVWWPDTGIPVQNEDAFASWPEWVLEKIAITKPMPKRTFDASAIEKFRNTGIEHLIRFVAEAAEGQRNSILFWAACRVGEAVRAGAITESIGIVLLETASSQCRLPLEAARKTISSGISRGFSS